MIRIPAKLNISLSTPRHSVSWRTTSSGQFHFPSSPLSPSTGLGGLAMSTYTLGANSHKFIPRTLACAPIKWDINFIATRFVEKSVRSHRISRWTFSTKWKKYIRLWSNTESDQGWTDQSRSERTSEAPSGVHPPIRRNKIIWFQEIAHEEYL